MTTSNEVRRKIKQHLSQSNLDCKGLVIIRCKSHDVGVALDGWLNCKLHLDAGVDRADVPIEFESVQYESNVNVSSRFSI